MEFSHYSPAPMQLQKELVAKAEKERAGEEEAPHHEDGGLELAVV